MKNKKLVLALIALVVVTVILAALNIGSSPEISKGELLIQTETDLLRIRPGEYDLIPVAGTIVNGKGEEIPVEAMGLPLQELLQVCGIADYQTVTVAARDEYRVEVTAQEIRTDGRAYLTVDDNGTFRLVVFGDPNSKRNVSDVIQLIVS